MNKELKERLNDIKEEMTGIVDTAKTENRELSEEELTQFGNLEAEAERVNKTIEAEEKVSKMSTIQIVTPAKISQEEQDIKDFAHYIRNAVNGEVVQANITKGDNGAVIPTSIGKKIIEEIKDISPIFERAQHYNVKGTLNIPTVTDANNSIAMDYASEFTDLTAAAAQFTSVPLTGFVAGVLCKVSTALINNSDFDIVNEVIHLMAMAAAEFFEKEALIGTSGKATGLSTLAAGRIVTAASATAITADELISVQDKLKSSYQRNACWIVAPATLTAIRKLKESGTGAYLLTPDYRAGFGYTLLGKPVFTSDQCPAMTTGNKSVVYGDFGQGLAVKMIEDFEVQVLKELYAAQHATGLVGWTEFDCKIQNEQAIAMLKQA